MKAFVLLILLFVAGSAQAIIPVSSWPRVIQIPGKNIIHPTQAQCLSAGYRLADAMPTPPAGYRIVTATPVQHETEPTRCTWSITTEEIPVVPPNNEELTKVNCARTKALFNSAGKFRGMIWLDAP